MPLPLQLVPTQQEPTDTGAKPNYYEIRGNDSSCIRSAECARFRGAYGFVDGWCCAEGSLLHAVGYGCCQRGHRRGMHYNSTCKRDTIMILRLLSILGLPTHSGCCSGQLILSWGAIERWCIEVVNVSVVMDPGPRGGDSNGSHRVPRQFMLGDRILDGLACWYNYCTRSRAWVGVGCTSPEATVAVVGWCFARMGLRRCTFACFSCVMCHPICASL